jgi:hypothetical protein
MYDQLIFLDHLMCPHGPANSIAAIKTGVATAERRVADTLHPVGDLRQTRGDTN